MRLTRYLLAVLLMTGLVRCQGSMIDSRATDPSLRPLARVDDYAVYFSDDRMDALSAYDMAIVDPDAQPPEAVRAMDDAGVLTIAYVSLGEAEAYRSFYDDVDRRWLLGANPNWPDHYYVDARERGWQRLLLDQVLPDIFAKGYDGLFFDTVDTAMPELFPETRAGMVELIEAIHERYPDAVLIMNNGLFLVDEVAGSIDGVTVESVFTRYRFDAETYGARAEASRRPLVERLARLRDEHDLRIFTIDYAGPADTGLRAAAEHEARERGFVPFVSNIALDTIYPPLHP